MPTPTTVQFARYAAFTAGLVYGVVRHSSLASHVAAEKSLAASGDVWWSAQDGEKQADGHH
ncbi:uncharacterized protein AMSG_11706 [Thecamonas trahens ATCC 50062]|uniref:Uncharacterized protein n=1 Tax=Thecamonas trahens ATCC 50062 TaxID=461836 RepID=A0A0L0DXX4_THETB|nr:hypothetical protein AMSG_11706 [Thecamonas trahens ATCC 50062]KNC56383.1 hypothetical protein AMSG_11706 [Thecamonas trahens ATCC 50062]|eukprot:XP_013760999.1 hypothetical protein AMSG_11706 [Thecamonas trahens ATCC 50062]